MFAYTVSTTPQTYFTFKLRTVLLESEIRLKNCQNSLSILFYNAVPIHIKGRLYLDEKIKIFFTITKYTLKIEFKILF